MSEPCFEVTSIETSGEVDRLNKLNLTLNSLASYIKSPSISSIDTLTPREEYFSGVFLYICFVKAIFLWGLPELINPHVCSLDLY